MSAPRKSEVDRRLDAHFAALRASPLRVLPFKEALKRSAATWQLYAAVTGSAVAMATGASAASIRNNTDAAAPGPSASVTPGNQHLASSRIPLMNLLRLNAPRKSAANPQTTQASQTQPPSISPGGVVPVFGTAGTIQPGEWVSIYGTNLAADTVLWNGDFPVSLGNTSVTIDGKPAYLLYVSPGQINLQAPDDTAAGTVTVVVTTPPGSAMSTVTLSEFAPSFSLLDTKHVAGIILRSNGLGAYGGGTYDILGPTGNTLGYSTIAAKPGDSVVIFGVGFGPTTPAVASGQVYSGAAPANNPVALYINHIVVKPTFAGISSAGLYQINLTVPDGVGYGDVPLEAIVGGLQTQAGVVFSVEAPVYPITGSGAGGTVPIVSSHGFFSSQPGFGTFPGGTFSGGGGFGGGSGGGSSAARKKKPFEPKKLQFPPK